MMKKALGILLFVSMLLTSAAYAWVNIEEVKIDDDVVQPNGVNTLDVERGDELKVKVRIVALQDAEDVQIEAALRGVDISESIDDITETFDIKSGVTYIETLHLPLKQKMDQDTYLLRIRVENKHDTTISKEYELEVDTQEHDVEIRDVVLSPTNEVEAGKALLATVRVRNRGENDEEGVKIVVSVPELGISAADFIDEMEAEGQDDDEATSEELFLRIPDDAKSGTYTVRVEAVFDEGDDKSVKESSIYIRGKEAAPKSAEGSDKTIITVAADGQNAVQGGSEAAYPITLMNAGSNAKTYMFSADGASWATLRVSPSNVMVLEPGDSKAITVYVAAKENAPAGMQTFTLTVSTADKVLKQIPLSVNVQQADGSVASLKRGLEVGLVVLVILLVIIGLIIGFSKMRNDDEEEGSDQEKTYY